MKKPKIDTVIAAKLDRDEGRKNDPDYMERLREEERRKYLEKREGEQLELKRKQVKDREWVYQHVPVTEAERKDLDLERAGLEAAETVTKERETSGDFQSYVLPDSYDEDMQKRLAVAYQKAKPEKKVLSEQQVWEEHQTKASVAKYGALSGKEKVKYDLLDAYGNAIEFTDADTLPQIKFQDDEEGADYDLSRDERAKKSQLRRETQKEKLKRDREALPVYKYRADLLAAIRDYKVLIVVGETGSGKTTQIPQYLDEVGYGDRGRIGCTQPRRVAAMSVAARVATEMGVKLGHKVGYSIRFEDRTSDSTVLKYMTDGMLLREFLGDPELSGYSAIMVDEAHERTLHTDVIFGLVKDLSRHRDDLRVIISSATLEAEKFSAYFDNAPIFKIPGRRYPVDLLYTKVPEANFIDAAVVTVLQIHLTVGNGDILVFLPAGDRGSAGGAGTAATW
eukprot:GHVU01103390.1.p1 GENE.GHVU01103390.1~~GHVU01103390.1.p1  ORF type:complete len:451 (-),score=82.71 GHVU01103390.1:370-1722(-)